MIVGAGAVAGPPRGTQRLVKTVVVTQSNYIPWRGYFDLLRSADEIVLLDSVQYTRRDWRNRNRIKTAQGPAWLTIPVEVKGRYWQAIDETVVADPDWSRRHRRRLELSYRRAPHYETTAQWLFPLFDEVSRERLLSVINERLLRGICAHLGIDRIIRRCEDVVDRAALLSMTPSDRLLALATALGATHYLSGPAARDYLDVGLLAS